MNTTAVPQDFNVKIFRHLSAFGVGVLFALGLGVGGMTQPATMIGFLDVFGDWDPSLLGVMGGGVLVNMFLHPLVTRRKQPLFEGRFGIPTRRDIDIKLLLGAAIFGVGWGLSGFCPGPGVIGLADGAISAVVFVGFMSAGMFIEKGISARVFR